MSSLASSVWVLIISLFWMLPAQGKAYTATFRLGLTEKKVYLASFYGEKMNVLDSGLTSEKGLIQFQFPQTRNPGLYRVFANRQQFLDFIFNGEDIDVEMNFVNPQPAPIVHVSVENEIFYGFLKEENSWKKKLQVLSVTGQEYPEKDAFYLTAEKEYYALHKQRRTQIAQLQKKHQDSYVAHVLSLYLEPLPGFSLQEAERKQYMRDHFFDDFTLRDSLLIRSNLLSSKAIDYLSLYAGPGMGQSEVEKAFIKGVDVILAQLESDQDVYTFMLSYLAGGFEKYKMEQVLTHLYEKYLSGSHCTGDVKEDELARRLGAYEKLAVGKTAPVFRIHDEQGKAYGPDDFKDQNLLLVFWASWCTHCHELLTQLPGLQQKLAELKVKVITVTLDTSRTAWLDYLNKNAMPWVNTMEGGGWNSPVSLAFNIYASPTMFLLDAHRSIVAKPISWMDLTEALKSLGGE